MNTSQAHQHIHVFDDTFIPSTTALSSSKSIWKISRPKITSPRYKKKKEKETTSTKNDFHLVHFHTAPLKLAETTKLYQVPRPTHTGREKLNKPDADGRGPRRLTDTLQSLNYHFPSTTVIYFLINNYSLGHGQDVSLNLSRMWWYCTYKVH